MGRMEEQEKEGSRGSPVEIYVPVVLRGQRTHRLEKVALGVVALLGGRVGLGVLAQAGEATGKELRTGSHDGDGKEEQSNRSAGMQRKADAKAMRVEIQKMPDRPAGDGRRGWRLRRTLEVPQASGERGLAVRWGRGDFWGRDEGQIWNRQDAVEKKDIYRC